MEDGDRARKEAIRKVIDREEVNRKCAEALAGIAKRFSFSPQQTSLIEESLRQEVAGIDIGYGIDSLPDMHARIVDAFKNAVDPALSAPTIEEEFSRSLYGKLAGRT